MEASILAYGRDESRAHSFEGSPTKISCHTDGGDGGGGRGGAGGNGGDDEGGAPVHEQVVPGVAPNNRRPSGGGVLYPVSVA